MVETDDAGGGDAAPDPDRHEPLSADPPADPMPGTPRPGPPVRDALGPPDDRGPPADSDDYGLPDFLAPDDDATAGRGGPDKDGFAHSLLRTPPQNLEAEMGLLGAILVNNRAHERVIEFLRPEHFADPVHQRIFEACGVLIDRNQIANPVTLKSYFDQDGALGDIGGAHYLVQLAASMVTVINAADYGRAIYDAALRRELINIGEDLVNGAYHFDLDRDAETQIQDAEEALFKLAESGTADANLSTLHVATEQAIQTAQTAFKRQSSITGVTTGLRDLDKMMGGLHPSDLIILAARPSMGKTALATNIAFNAAYEQLRNPEDGAAVAFFSLEMSAEQLANRILSEQTMVRSDDIRRGNVTQEHFTRFVAVAQDLSRMNFFIDDTPGITVAQLRNRARRLKRSHDIGLLVVDYLQLMQGSSTSRSESRVLEISEITRGLKGIAKELHVPVVALSQLSRQVENRDDKRPQLADLRESGSIEQDADVVMFIFRQEYYESRREPMEGDENYAEKKAKHEEKMEKIRNIAEIIIGKQRHGPIGTVRALFDAEHTAFKDLEFHDYSDYD